MAAAAPADGAAFCHREEKAMRIKTAAVTAATVVLVTAGAGTSAAQAHSGCATRWGSLPEAGATMSTASITNVRAGRHACFDRLVVDLNGPVGRSYDARYVPTVHTDGEGAPLPLRGGADLQLIVRAPAHDADYNPTYRPANRRELVSTRGFRTFRQVASGGTFEGQTTLGLGVRARLPFRVLVVPGPGRGSRLVVDVAHHW
jgi:hypothetical protein